MSQNLPPTAPPSRNCHAGLDSFSPEIRSLVGVSMLFRQLDGMISSLSTDPELTPPEMRLTMFLIKPARMGEIAQGLFALPSSVTAAADGLEAKGLVLREKDPTDRRALVLRLTEAGLEARAALEQKFTALFRDTTDLSTDEITHFAALIDKTRKHILATGFSKELM